MSLHKLHGQRRRRYAQQEARQASLNVLHDATDGTRLCADVLTFGKAQVEDFNLVFKLFLPRVTERNGRVCCYRIYLIRQVTDNVVKPSPEDIDVMTY